ncbi:MAG: DUF4249 domain-containing protein [Marinifilaceae bacterium]
MTRVVVFSGRFMALMVFLSCLFLYLGCEDELKIDAEKRSSKLVVNSVVNPEAIFEVHISQSLGLTQPGDLKYLENAVVKVTNRKDQTKTVLPHNYQGFYFLDGFKPDAGSSYSIEVSHPGYVSATSSTQVPNPVTAEFIDSLRTFRHTVKVLDIDLKIVDPNEEQNYYIIEALRNFTVEQEGQPIEQYYIAMLLTQDPASENDDFGSNVFLNRIYLPDQKFSGKTYQLKISSELFFEDQGGTLEILVKSVSKDLYDYLKSLEQFRMFGDDPNFSSPIQVRNNIVDGLGVFGSFTQERIVLSFAKNGND